MKSAADEFLVGRTGSVLCMEKSEDRADESRRSSAKADPPYLEQPRFKPTV